MLRRGSSFFCLDNSSARWLKNIRIFFNAKTATLTTFVKAVVSITKKLGKKKHKKFLEKRFALKKKSLVLGVVSSVKVWRARHDGSLLRFSRNGIIMLDQKRRMLGSVFLSRLPLEFRLTVSFVGNYFLKDFIFYLH